MKSEIKKGLSFTDDKEKVRDLKTMNKKEFLEFYSYLTEEEYNITIKEMKK